MSARQLKEFLVVQIYPVLCCVAILLACDVGVGRRSYL